MKKNILFFVFALMICFSFSSKRRSFIRLEGMVMGTTYSIKYLSPQGAIYRKSIDSILYEVDFSLSTYKATSVISKVNKSDSVAIVNQHFARVFKEAKNAFNITLGAFNPAVFNKVDAWGFGPSDKILSDTSIENTIFDFNLLELKLTDSAYIIKPTPNIKIDFSAIAKGYAVDQVSEFFESVGVKHYMVEVGGEIRVGGENERKKAWQIDIEKPEYISGIQDGSLYARITLENNKSIATSGGYRNFRYLDGDKYSHIINPATGKPVKNNILSVSVIADNCAKADALATGFVVLGAEKTIEIVETLEEVEAFLVYRSEKGDFFSVYSSGLSKNIKMLSLK